MEDIFTSVCNILKTGEDLALIRVVSDKGSTPRSTGARMAICRNGQIAGTIGGGIVDAMAIKKAMEAFETTCSAVSTVDMSAEDAAGADMICGGKLEFLCEYIPSDDQTIRFFESLNASLRAHRKQMLCTEFDENEECRRTVCRFLLKDGDINKEFPISTNFQNKLREMSKTISGSALVVIDGRKYCVDVLESKESLFIFGAGHVAKEVATLAMNVGFHVIVLDDREMFANRERFPAPSEVIVIDSFKGCIQNLQIDEHSYVVIVTRGHAHDKTVLAQALKTFAGYIGMIGSRKKRDAIYKALMGEGFTGKNLERVHSPIGLPIDTETPEEIAVSIVGQLIQQRSQKR